MKSRKPHAGEADVVSQNEWNADAAGDEAIDHALREALPMVPPVTDTAETRVDKRLVLEKKHPLAIRWMHWVNFPVLFTMIWSGILIYWNDSDNAYRHPHEVYR
jgi:hypothetical protein